MRGNDEGQLNLDLISHPATPPVAVQYVAVQVEREVRGLRLFFVVEGDPSKIVTPAPAKPYRTDGLWRTTCFELFVRNGGQDYREFNLSPSSQWAAYRFDVYRGEPENLGLDEPPTIGCSRELEGLFLWSSLKLGIGQDTQIGLSAVIEETDGTKSYWALAHPDPDKPDFHHPDSFTLRLDPAAD